MNGVHTGLYEVLNDFLPPYTNEVRFANHFQGFPSVEDLIESNGVQHSEIDIIMAYKI